MTTMSDSLLREVTIRSLSESIETLSAALELLRKEEYANVCNDLDAMLKKAERVIKVSRLILN